MTSAAPGWRPAYRVAGGSRSTRSGWDNVSENSRTGFCGRECATAGCLHEEVGQRGDAEGVSMADRAHGDELAVDQLHAFFRAEDAGLGHPLDLVDGEAPP